MEPNDEIIWFYIRDHQQQGPVGIFELKKMFEHGVLNADTYLWTKGMKHWQMAKTLDLFPQSMLKTTQKDSNQKNYAIDWTEEKNPPYSKGRPVVRYLGRFFDLSLCSLILISLVSIFLPRFIIDFAPINIFILNLVIWILLEPFILSIFGTTPGKALLNQKLVSVNGERIDFWTALQRSIFVSAAGMGFGVPVINFICFCFSYADLKKHGKSTWDHQIGTVVLYGQVSSIRIFIAGLFPIGLLVAGVVVH